jgi:hypothetical protein
MKPTTKALLAAGALGAAVAAVFIPLAANADKTVVYRTANAEVVRMEFVPQAGGAVQSLVCGRTQDSLGNFTQPTCYPIALPAGNAIAVSATSLANGGALTFWKTQEGL